MCYFSTTGQITNVSLTTQRNKVKNKPESTAVNDITHTPAIKLLINMDFCLTSSREMSETMWFIIKRIPSQNFSYRKWSKVNVYKKMRTRKRIFIKDGTKKSVQNYMDVCVNVAKPCLFVGQSCLLTLIIPLLSLDRLACQKEAELSFLLLPASTNENETPTSRPVSGAANAASSVLCLE